VEGERGRGKGDGVSGGGKGKGEGRGSEWRGNGKPTGKGGRDGAIIQNKWLEIGSWKHATPTHGANGSVHVVV